MSKPAAELVSLMDFQRCTDLVLVSVAPPRLALLSCPFSPGCRTHTKAIEGQTAPLSARWLRALLMLASAIKTAFLFPPCLPVLLLEVSPLPRRAVRLKWKKGCVTPLCRLCVAVCQGKGVAAWCDTLDYTGWLGIISGFQRHAPKTETLGYVFSSIIITSCRHISLTHHSADAKCFFIFCKTCYCITSLKVQ